MKVEEIIAAMKRSAKLNKSWPISEEIKAWAECLEARWKEDKERVDENTSDGYHTFKELYRYRMLYNAGMFNLLAKYTDIKVVKSCKHNDGEKCFGGGWFIVTANLPTGQVSNHYEEKYWDLFTIPSVERAPKWDGHTPNEAADRIEKFLSEKIKGRDTQERGVENA